LWRFSKNKQAAKDLLLYLSQKPAVTKVVEASFGYDLPAFKTMYDLDIWNTVGPPLGTVYGYPPRGDERPRSPAHRRARKSPPKSTTRRSIP
jgi:hypothetical protein